MIDWTNNLILPVLVIVIGAFLVWFFHSLWKKLTKTPDGGSGSPGIDDKLIDSHITLAKEFGATEAQLNQLLKTLEDHDIPPDQLDARLKEMLGRDEELLERLDAAPAVNPETDQLRKEAGRAITNGDHDRAADLLRQAEARDTQAAAEMDDRADGRRRAAAESATAQGNLALNRLDYAAAAEHFERGARLLPEADAVGRGETLNMAGLAYFELADYEKAETAFQESRTLLEDVLAEDDPELAPVLNNLAGLYRATNRLAEAEPLMKRALKIDEAAFGPDHPNVAIRLNNLAQLYQATNRLAEAEPLMKRALEIDEAAFGPDHPEVATDLNNLATLYQATNRLAEAEPLMERALKIIKAGLGPDHPNTIAIRNNLAVLREKMAGGD